MDLSDLMEQAAEDGRHVPTDDELKSIAQLAEEQVFLESKLAQQTAELAATQEQLNKVQQFDLPGALERLGMSQFKLTDGSFITIKEDTYAGITEENKPKAFAWLKSTGNDGIIKNEFKVPFGKGQDEEAAALAKALDTFGCSYTNNRSVHPQTLKAFVKSRLENGEPVPTDIFSIHTKKMATIGYPKVSKKSLQK